MRTDERPKVEITLVFCDGAVVQRAGWVTRGFLSQNLCSGTRMVSRDLQGGYERVVSGSKGGEANRVCNLN